MIRVSFVNSYGERKEGILVSVTPGGQITVLLDTGHFYHTYEKEIDVLNLTEIFPPKEQPQTAKENVPEKVKMICLQADKGKTACRQCDRGVPHEETSECTRMFYCWRRETYTHCVGADKKPADNLYVCPKAEGCSIPGCQHHAPHVYNHPMCNSACPDKGPVRCVPLKDVLKKKEEKKSEEGLPVKKVKKNPKEMMVCVFADPSKRGCLNCGNSKPHQKVRACSEGFFCLIDQGTVYCGPVKTPKKPKSVKVVEDLLVCSAAKKYGCSVCEHSHPHTKNTDCSRDCDDDECLPVKEPKKSKKTKQYRCAFFDKVKCRKYVCLAKIPHAYIRECEGFVCGRTNKEAHCSPVK